MARSRSKRAGGSRPQRGAEGAVASPARAPARFVLPWQGALGLVLLAALWLQRRAIAAPFFADDFLFLEQVRFRSLWTSLTGPDPIGNFVRPVGRQLWFWVLGRLGHESPVLFHAMSLALFLVAIALLFSIVRRLAGAVAATIAAAFLAMHYAPDVVLLWASGSQDLLALAGALAAIALFLAGRRAWAAAALLVALLSKETVLLTPVVAALAARRKGEPWRASARRAWPLAVAVLAWAALWLSVVARSPGARHAVGASAGGLAAAFVHLVQVAVGAEWRRGGHLQLLLPIVPLAFATFALTTVAEGRRAPAREGEEPALRPWALGLAWALLGALPVAAVAPVWSAYYYLFALCGVALALGDRLARAPRGAAFAALLALGWGSEQARRLDEFITAPGAWTTLSHVNRRYVERADLINARYLRQVRLAHPVLAPRTSVFFGGLLSFTSFQVADGPFLRWAYRDTSLRSYYLFQFAPEMVRRGPVVGMVATDDSLIDYPLTGGNLHGLALTATASLRPRFALEVLDLPGAAIPNTFGPYWKGWLALGAGDSARAWSELRAAGVELRGAPTPEVALALQRLAAGDTAGAVDLLVDGVSRHALDAEPHLLLGGLRVMDPNQALSACLEAYAATLLAPRLPRTWLLMGYVQLQAGRYAEARTSMERFLALGGGTAREDSEARRMIEWIRARGPGGSRTQAELHGSGAGP